MPPRRDLASELCALEAEDDRVRARLAAEGSLFRGYAAEEMAAWARAVEWRS